MYEGHEDPTHKEAGYIQLRVNQPAGEGPHFQLQEARTSLRTKAAAYVCLGLGLDLGVWMELGHGDWAGSAVGCGLARLWKNRSGGDEKSRLPLCCRRAGRDLGHLNQLSWRLSRWHLWATAACSNLQLADRRDTAVCVRHATHWPTPPRPRRRRGGSWLFIKLHHLSRRAKVGRSATVGLLEQTIHCTP